MKKEITGWEKSFDEKFARINHIHRGECAITDVTGSRWQAHTENGVVTEVGGLESVKDFIRDAIASAVESRDAFWQKNEEQRLKKYEALGFHKGKLAREREISEAVNKLQIYEYGEMLDKSEVLDIINPSKE